MAVKKPIAILGSSASHGKTWEALNLILSNDTTPIIDLNQKQISPFDYGHNNRDDDFFSIMEEISNCDPLILATPVYWYTMSCQMKMFLDRFSDLLSLKKNLGRTLRGKKMFVVSSFGTSMPKGFELPFSQTAEYLGMSYLGCCYYYSGNDEILLKENPAQITDAKKRIFG